MDRVMMERPATTGATAVAKGLQTPHTLRLLKLIREGTPEYSDAAVCRLEATAAPSSPIQLWDLLGRLQAFLVVPEWQTRAAAAQALQVVARHLPVSDQSAFLERVSFHRQDDDDAETSLRISDKKELDASMLQSKALYLTVGELLQDEGGIDQVLAEGRELLATAEASYSVGGEGGKVVNDEVLLQQLDQSSGTTANFLQARVRMQRQILASRLGLAAIGDAIGEEAATGDTITIDDVIEPLQESPKSKRQKHAEQIQYASQKQRKDSADPARARTNAAEEAVEMEASNPHSVRALLVMEMQAQQQRSSYSHTNPQTLLATELIYRMLDPVWYVRHGAVLGILSLLRAWKENHNIQNDSTKAVSGNRRFGAWPQDILARCLCVLALDRFGDFSGAFDAISSTSVVAPVREVAGQLLSVLMAMAPDTIFNDALEILYRLCRYSGEWEARHGALVALKYVTVVGTTRILDSVQLSSRGCYEKYAIQQIAAVAIGHLEDDSDDVKSVAAQILIEAAACVDDTPCGGQDRHRCFPAFLWKAVPRLWHALQLVRDVSSCIVDLVALFAIFVEHDCAAILRQVNTKEACCVDQEGSSEINNVGRLLLRLLDSDFHSVRVSALRCIGVLSQDRSFASGSRDRKYDQAMHETCKLLIQRVFELFFNSMNCAASEPNEKCERVPKNVLDDVWKGLSDASIKIFGVHKDYVDALLMSRYFRRDALLPVEAADAVAYFLCLAANCKRASAVTETALLAYLYSPWTSQCEAAFLLFRAIVNNLSDLSSLQSFERLLDQEAPLICLRVQFDSLVLPITSSLAAICDKVILNNMIEVMGRSKSPTEAAAVVTRTWMDALRSREDIVVLESGDVSPVASMRVRATLAGAVLAKGLPNKLTSLIRALMTSFNNEAADRTRRIQTSKYLTQLLLMIGNEPKFQRAHAKILITLCEAAIPHTSTTVMATDQTKLAATVLRTVVRHIPPGGTLNGVTALWSRLSPLTSKNTCGAEPSVFLDSISLLKVLCGGLGSNDAMTSGLIDDCLPTLVRLACENSQSEVRVCAVSGIVALCSVAPGYLLKGTIPLLAPSLQDRNQDARRLSACLLLRDLVEAAGTEIGPFVRCLLPLVLSLVTDHISECAQISNSTFASLVRVAPLVRQHSSETIRTHGEHGESVIDHLIFGKALPPCDFPIQISDGLSSRGIVLREYQKEGISWLRFLQTVHLSGALCDDMGTGKSVQALVAVALAHCDILDANRISQPRSLVVCPSTLVGHWTEEIKKYFPAQSIFRSLSLVGNRSERQAVWNGKCGQFNMVIISYAVLRSDIDYLECEQWCYCILDEGHLLKNPKTVTALASRRLRARHKLILTGTPIQNRVHELWATFDFLMPNFLGTSKSFANNFANPIAKGQLPNASASNIADGIMKLKVLHQQVLPFILRREKAQVLPELPATTTTVVRVAMSRIQERIYRDFCAGTEATKSLDTLGPVLENPRSRPASMSADLLKSLLFLRLLCTHPSLILTTSQRKTCPSSFFNLDASAKLLALAELLRDAGLYDDNITGADNDTSLLYCEDNEVDDQDSFASVLHTPDHFVGTLDATSSKFLSSAPSTSTKCLVFAQFTKSLDAVEELLFKAHMPSLRYVRLDGTVAPDKRMKIVNAFDQDPTIRVMLLTTRVGGLGLNLTVASTVIFLESDFNPFADLQAIDRCRRIGQTKVVNVYRIITKDSIEEKILVLQEKKVLVSDAIVNTDNSTMYSMGTDRLLDVFTMRDSAPESEGATIGLNYDLDGLIERCADDYKSLSVSQFTISFGDM